MSDLGTMTYREVEDALGGMFAYDTGYVDSGIHDELLRQRVKNELLAMPDSDRRAMLAWICREMFFTDNKIDQGYGVEDAGNFASWLDDQGLLV